jgi:hypothetical protein
MGSVTHALAFPLSLSHPPLPHSCCRETILLGATFFREAKLIGEQKILLLSHPSTLRGCGISGTFWMIDFVEQGGRI